MEGEAKKKRGNERQLTQFDEVDDTVGEGEESNEFQVASQEQLSQRRFVSTRKNRNKNNNITESNNQNQATEKPKFDFNFPSNPINPETNKISFDNQPKLEFNFDNQQKPTFDFNFGGTTPTTNDFKFEWNPTDNPFANNSAFLETKSTFESSDKLFSNNNESQSNTFGKIAQNQEKEGLNFSNNEEKEQEEDVVDNTEPIQVIKPIVNLKEEQQKTGEEDEEKLFAERAKLFILLGEGDKKSWKERGLGKLTINKSKDGSSRFVFRTDQTRMVRLNALIYKGMVSKIIAEKGVTFFVVDSSDGDNATLQSFFVRFQNKDLAQKLLAVLQDIEKGFGSSATTEKKTAPTPITINTPSKVEEKPQPVKSNKTVITIHAYSTFVEGNFRGIITFVQNSEKNKTLIEGTFKGAEPNSKFTLNLDNKTITSFPSNSSGDITFVANKVVNLIGSSSSLGSHIIVQQDGTFNSWTSQIKKDDEN